MNKEEKKKALLKRYREGPKDTNFKTRSWEETAKIVRERNRAKRTRRKIIDKLRNR
ncbi:hypothetical protein GCM10007216_19810 [Thalassobacillus devorans]|uniref:Transcriptional regulator n=1 Tax=Thalassobacillus devorans TaxID=279813 RepID=A0ABQ1P1B0_9BACI|nr:hypothetical protein [Thalassobacillus devorans]NIK28075.1 hypothetical protein [Thalassobacillus devorans]GGC89066.1 hypothetical protein GCM10007216_19810 [Thalassobacillus devorans]